MAPISEAIFLDNLSKRQQSCRAMSVINVHQQELECAITFQELKIKDIYVFTMEGAHTRHERSLV